MKCAIMQPTYLSWLGYFDLIDSVDNFIFLENVQLEKSSWQQRNRIKTHDGELILTVHRKKNKGKSSLSLIKDTEINDNNQWRRKHIKSIEDAYRKALFFEEVFTFIYELINRNYSKLGEFNINIITSISKKIGSNTNFINASEINLNENDKIQRLIKICKYLNCNEYISPKGSFSYIQENSGNTIFKENEIELLYHNYSHPFYSQLYGDFLPYMSIIDLLFNHGFDKSLEILKRGRDIPIKHENIIFDQKYF